MTDQDQGHSPVKLMFRLLQCLHHLAMLADDEGIAVKAFTRKAHELDRFIRPAIPNASIFKKVQTINEAWVGEVTLALREHYQTQIDFLSGSLKAWNLSNSDFFQTKTKALEWARRHYGRRLNTKALTELEKLMTSLRSPPKPTPSTSTARNHRLSEPGTGPVGGETSRPGTPPSSQSASNATKTHSPASERRRHSSPSYATAARSPPSQASNSKPPRVSKVTRFPGLGNRKRKITEMCAKWAIPRITKDILMIGTSNFSRIPWVDRDDAHILRYPGLKLRNLNS